MTADVNDYVDRVTLADGAWGTELYRLSGGHAACLEELNLTQPNLVERLAAAYVTAGSQIILTNTFGANAFALRRSGHEDRMADYNRAGAEISSKAAAGRARVFGAMGPSGEVTPTHQVAEPALYEAFKAQADALAQGGVNGLVIETMSSLTEAAIAIRAAKTTGLLVVGCMSFNAGDGSTKTLMGVTPKQAAVGLAEAGADILGCNCGVGIDNDVKVAAMFHAASDKPIWVKASAGLPEMQNGRPVYRTTPDTFAKHTKDLIAAGASIIGGCCGAGPAFIAAMAKACCS